MPKTDGTVIRPNNEEDVERLREQWLALKPSDCEIVPFSRVSLVDDPVSVRITRELEPQIPPPSVKTLHQAAEAGADCSQVCARCGISVAFPPWRPVRAGSWVEMTPNGRVLYHALPGTGAYQVCKDA